MENLREQIVDELHRPARKNYPRRKVITKSIDDLWQIDLVEMNYEIKENRKFKYILTVIDVFSKFAWAKKLLNKTASSVADALENIFTQSERIPKNIQTDDGSEFFNSTFKAMMKRYKINHYSTFSNLKASVVERFNRSLKSIMYKSFSLRGNYNWTNHLDDFVELYNNRVHSKIKLKPVEVTKENEQDILKNIYREKPKLLKKTKFSVGSFVRISKYKNIFEKSYTPNFTTEIFKIVRIDIRKPEVYYLQDYLGEDVKGMFYCEELTSVKDPQGYLVEKILKKRGNKVLVKYLGFSETHNEWLDKDSVI